MKLTLLSTNRLLHKTLISGDSLSTRSFVQTLFLVVVKVLRASGGAAVFWRVFYGFPFDMLVRRCVCCDNLQIYLRRDTRKAGSTFLHWCQEAECPPLSPSLLFSLVPLNISFSGKVLSYGMSPACLPSSAVMSILQNLESWARILIVSLIDLALSLCWDQEHRAKCFFEWEKEKKQLIRETDIGYHIKMLQCTPQKT